jgi:hypothetical protein
MDFVLRSASKVMTEHGIEWKIKSTNLNHDDDLIILIENDGKMIAKDCPFHQFVLG